MVTIQSYFFVCVHVYVSKRNENVYPYKCSCELYLQQQKNGISSNLQQVNRPTNCVYLYNRIQLSHQKEQNTDTHKDIGKSQEYYAEPHELDMEVYITCFHLCETQKQGKLIYSDRKQITRVLSEVMEIFSNYYGGCSDGYICQTRQTYIQYGCIFIIHELQFRKSIFFKCSSRNYVLKMLKRFRIYEASGCRGRREGGSGWWARGWHAPISRKGFLEQVF